MPSVILSDNIETFSGKQERALLASLLPLPVGRRGWKWE